MYTVDYSPFQSEVQAMTSDVIRFELENLQGLFWDSDDRAEWSILNTELKRRNESPVRYRSSERAL